MLTLGRGQTDKVQHDAGMTLIELLVVVAVFAVLSVGITLVLGQSRTSDAPQDAGRFLELWQRQSDFARQSRTPHGVTVETGALQPMRLGSNGWNTNGARIPLDTRATVAARQRSGQLTAPDLVILPSGQSTAFQITFAGGPSSTPSVCQSDGWDKATCN